MKKPQKAGKIRQFLGAQSTLIAQNKANHPPLAGNPKHGVLNPKERHLKKQTQFGTAEHRSQEPEARMKKQSQSSKGKSESASMNRTDFCAYVPLLLCAFQGEAAVDWIMQNKANLGEGKLTQEQQLQWFMEIQASGGAEKTKPNEASALPQSHADFTKVRRALSIVVTTYF